MAFKPLALNTAASLAAMILVLAPAGARPNRAPGDSAAGFARDGYDDRDRQGHSREDDFVLSRGDQRQQRMVENRAKNCRRDAGGTLLSAVAGGLLGNATRGRRGSHGALDVDC